MQFLDIKPNDTVTLASPGQLPEQVHVFDQDSIEAVNAALAARRPLLIRGEPGVGKSQLARAVAKKLQRVFIQYVVDVHCESRDLLWHFDAVKRLADAQLGNALGNTPAEIQIKLDIKNYLDPGPLWWAFDWQRAAEQAERLDQSPPMQYKGSKASNGSVLLIDEIDKAEMDVPNGLLEALGDGRFTPMGWKEPICASETFPLVIITTNEERALPNAFLRRCLVLNLDLFNEKNDVFAILVQRGQAHFPELDEEQVIKKAANLLIEDRATAKAKQQQPLPGQAEYLDLLRAVDTLSRLGKGEPQQLIDQVSRFIMNKQAGVNQ